MDQFINKLQEKLNSINKESILRNQDNNQITDSDFEISTDEEKSQLIDEINNKTVIERKPIYIK